MDFGIRCVIAPSFADIFYNNCFKNGLLPIALPQELVDQLIDDASKGANAVLTIDLESQTITRPDGETVHFDIDAFRKHCLLNGLDDIGLTVQKEADIAAFEAEGRRLSARGVASGWPATGLRAAARPIAWAQMAARAPTAKSSSSPATASGRRSWARSCASIDFFARRSIAQFEVSEGLVGGAAYDASGVPLTDATLAQAMAADAVLFGAVGGPKWDSLPFELQPERGLLRLRKEMDLFANLRPAIVFDALADASALKRELVAGLDLMILRELTGGIYFGDPRGIETLPDGTRRGINTEVYTEAEIERVARVGFELARKRQRRLTAVDKANVMELGVLWREVARRVHADYPDVELSFMYADNCAMQLVRQPKQFDVIVTSNLFGDLLSDCAAMLTGSLGMLPSASLGAPDATGRRKALYEPVHGSAPDIAGKGVANPLACVLSFAMMLRYSFDMPDEADLVEDAVRRYARRRSPHRRYRAAGRGAGARQARWATRSCASLRKAYRIRQDRNPPSGLVLPEPVSDRAICKRIGFRKPYRRVCSKERRGSWRMKATGVANAGNPFPGSGRCRAGAGR